MNSDSSTLAPAALMASLLAALGQVPMLVRGGEQRLDSAKLEELAAAITAKTSFLTAELSPFLFTTKPGTPVLSVPTAPLLEALDYFTVDGNEINAAITCAKRAPNQGQEADFVAILGLLAKRISTLRTHAGI